MAESGSATGVSESRRADRAGEPPSRVLVVDDVEANRDLLGRRVRRLGHDVLMAESGQAALAVLEREAVDVVLLDIMMPDMNGYQVLERIKTDERTRAIPVIMVSAVDEVESVVRCIDLGADDYLPKPFNPVILRARLDASLARKRLRDREQLHAQSLERELEIGRDIQQSFLPEALPVVPGYEIAALLEPARQVSGDFYDAFSVADGERVILAIGDVCDKGVGAALFMALFRSLIRTGLDPAFVRVDAEPEAALLRAVRFTNDYIARTHGRTNMFATLFLAELDVRTGRLTYVNCGQEPPLVLVGGRVAARLEVTGPAVGLMPDMEFAVGTVDLTPGMVMLAYTDGVPEVQAPSGEALGETRLIAFVERLQGTAADLQQHVRKVLAEFVGDAPQVDDVTLLVVRRAV